ncbi:hypothetical protein T439DRAFT_321495 [Meredithblackwellia eburnea MCA 4105]
MASGDAYEADGKYQKVFSLPRQSKGVYLITKDVVSNIEDGLKKTKIGMLNLFMLHTSAALSINENYDPDVRTDMSRFLDNLVPESFDWDHVDEGADDSVSHSKSSIVGVSLNIPIRDGKLLLGTWQGIYLMEFRDIPHVRKVVATIM